MRKSKIIYGTGQLDIDETLRFTSSIDGIDVTADVVDSETKLLRLNNILDKWKTSDVTITAKFELEPGALTACLHAAEDSKDLDFVLEISDFESRVLKHFPTQNLGGLSFCAELNLGYGELFNKARVRVLSIRKHKSPQLVDGVANRRFEFVGESESWHLIKNPASSVEGGGSLAMEWKDFEKEAQTSDFSNGAWYLHYTNPQKSPTVWLNINHDFQTLLEATGTTGRLARSRDLLYEVVFQDVMATMADVAIHSVKTWEEAESLPFVKGIIEYVCRLFDSNDPEQFLDDYQRDAAKRAVVRLALQNRSEIHKKLPKLYEELK